MSRQEFYSIYCFLFLACLEYFPIQSKIRYYDGITPSWVKKGKRHGGPLPYAYSRQFGMNGRVDRLKIRSILFEG